MNETQLNEAIARWMGWQIDEELEDGAVMGTPPGGGWDMVPDFCGDLNAIAQAEAKLTPAQWFAYAGYLDSFVTFQPPVAGLATKQFGDHPELFLIALVAGAKPKQKAEALVKALGLHAEDAFRGFDKGQSGQVKL